MLQETVKEWGGSTGDSKKLQMFNGRHLGTADILKETVRGYRHCTGGTQGHASD